jgi:hypothetical protein
MSKSEMRLFVIGKREGEESVSILGVAGIWAGSNILLFGWLVWQRVLAPPRGSFAQSAVVRAPLNQTSVILLFAPPSSQARVYKPADVSKKQSMHGQC